MSGNIPIVRIPPQGIRAAVYTAPPYQQPFPYSRTRSNRRRDPYSDTFNYTMFIFFNGLRTLLVGQPLVRNLPPPRHPGYFFWGHLDNDHLVEFYSWFNALTQTPKAFRAYCHFLWRPDLTFFRNPLYLRHVNKKLGKQLIHENMAFDNFFRERSDLKKPYRRRSSDYTKYEKELAKNWYAFPNHPAGTHTPPVAGKASPAPDKPAKTSGKTS